MKIVIDIDEEIYTLLMTKREARTSDVNKVYFAIASGTPLPKGKWERAVDKANHWVWECDKCSWQQQFATNYCPDCGADMRRGDADADSD